MKENTGRVMKPSDTKPPSVKCFPSAENVIKTLCNEVGVARPLVATLTDGERWWW